MGNNLVKVPRSGGGQWEMVRDSHDLIRYRRAGDLAWSYLDPVGVATLNLLHFGE